MPHVRSVAVGIWLTRGSRHEPAETSGIAHFVEHMLFKGTPTRNAEEIAQQVDSIGGQIDAFTSKEYAGYYLKVLDEHLPLAVDILVRPDHATRCSLEEDIEREKKVILEEIKMVEDTPDDLVHEMFAEGFWSNHPLGRPILGTPASVSALDQKTLRALFRRRPTSRRTSSSSPSAISITIACSELLERALVNAPHTGPAADESAPVVAPAIQVRKKELEQSHIVFGAEALPQHHPGALRRLRAQHHARRLDELAAVPERSREARSGLFGVLAVCRRIRTPARSAFTPAARTTRSPN